MRTLVGISIIALNLTFGCTAQNDFDLIEKTISTLKKESLNSQGEIVNSYSLRDLDNDGIFEIIETSNRIEKESIGFLNNELSVVFDYDEIYILTTNRYIESEYDVGDFLRSKIVHYELWKKLISNPNNLNSDSQIIIDQNKELFLKEIDWILKKINLKIKI